MPWALASGSWSVALLVRGDAGFGVADGVSQGHPDSADDLGVRLGVVLLQPLADLSFAPIAQNPLGQNQGLLGHNPIGLYIPITAVRIHLLLTEDLHQPTNSTILPSG